MFGLGSSTLTALGLIWLSAAVYFVPTFVAHRRGHPNELAITVLNTFAGWTVAGWIVAIVWASTRVDSPTSRKRISSALALEVALIPAVLLFIGSALVKALSK